jgi:hypothetical protein
MKVYGGWGSRGYPQKSLALFARKQYGAGKFEHDVFPGQDVDAFESLVLRNSGNDNQSTHQIPPRPPITEFGPTKSYGSYFVNGTFTLLRDAMMQRLLAGQTDSTSGLPPRWCTSTASTGASTTSGRSSTNTTCSPTTTSAPEGLRRPDRRLRRRAGRRFGRLPGDARLREFPEHGGGDELPVRRRPYLDIDNFIDYNLAVSTSRTSTSAT